MTYRFGKLPWLWISVLVFVLDQATKFYFEGTLRLYQQIVVIPDYFSWTLAYNTGAAFSFLADESGWQRWLFALIAVGVSAVLVVWMKRLKSDETWLAIALALVLGGALGNLTDRLFREPGFGRGHVVDFIAVPHFAIFNVADCGVVVGIGLVLLLILLNRDSGVARER